MDKTKKVITKVLILGTGGMCIDILDIMNELGGYTCIGFLDDDKEKWNKEYQGVRVLGPLTKAKEFVDAYFVNGIGNARNFLQKKTIIDRTGIPDEKFLSLVHPTASISKRASVGMGTVIFQHVTVASNAKIGNHVLIMANSVVSHDVIVGDYTYITGGACISGLVTIGRSSYLGTNCSIIGKITIGDNVLIGMGSVVLKDVPSDSVYVGNPAKFLRKINNM